jgi:hypothetical protein
MNPQQNQTPGLGLPPPSFGAGQAPFNQVPGGVGPAASTFDSMSSPMAQASLTAPVPQAMPPIAQPQAMPSAQAATAMPVESAATIQVDDSETALDEEWVNKAREIVERTHSDPYLQSRELSKIKAQYIKVRYNKDIKSSEDPS